MSDPALTYETLWCSWCQSYWERPAATPGPRPKTCPEHRAAAHQQIKNESKRKGHMRASRPWLVEELLAMRKRAPEVWQGDSPECRQAIAELVSVVGPLSLNEIGALLGFTRERARQVEGMALDRMRKRLRLVGVTEAPPEPEPTVWDLAELHAWGFGD